MRLSSEAFARAALAGNPSDGYHGKTLSLIVKNFRARAVLEISDRLTVSDPHGRGVFYKSIEDLMAACAAGEYTEPVRLAQAAIKKYCDWFSQERGGLPSANFSLSFESNIPQQVGLAGSSAIVTAIMRCLGRFFDALPAKDALPGLILAAETEELGISAGLQDRVAQVYEGLTFMDFRAEYFNAHGHGIYEGLDAGALSNIYAAYQLDKGESSEVIHNDIRRRFDTGESAVVEAMRDAALCAERARESILRKDLAGLSREIDRNFDIRTRIYNLDPNHIRMVETARRLGASANFAGSGGAIVGIYRAAGDLAKLRNAFRAMNCAVIEPIF